MISDEEMKQLLDQLIQRVHTAHQLYESLADTQIRPGPPATRAELQALKDHTHRMGMHVPDDYQQLLRVYNGVENVFYPLSLYSIREVIDDHAVIKAMFKDYPDCRDFIIGGGTRTGDKICFDKARPTPAGYEIAWLLEQGGEDEGEDGEPLRMPDVVTFLRHHLRVADATIQMEQEERAAPSHLP